MNRIEKLALKKLEAKKQNFESEKYQILIELLKNKSYKDIYKKNQSALIDYAKEPTQENKNALTKSQTLLQNLAKTLHKNSPLLEIEFLCNNCKDKGFVLNLPCTCLNQITSEMLMEDSGISLDALQSISNDFNIFDNPKNIQKTYAVLEKWATNFQTSQIKNWGFFGHAGTGKTHLMLYVMKKLIESGHFVHFTTAFNLTQQLLSQHTNFEDKNRDHISKYLECDVLFIDDMGTEPKYKNVNENYLYLILNQRMIEGKPIIFSSNFNMAQFEDFYGERIFSRLINKRNSKSLWFDGEDLRLKQ